VLRILQPCRHVTWVLTRLDGQLLCAREQRVIFKALQRLGEGGDRLQGCRKLQNVRELLSGCSRRLAAASQAEASVMPQDCASLATAECSDTSTTSDTGRKLRLTWFPQARDKTLMAMSAAACSAPEPADTPRATQLSRDAPALSPRAKVALCQRRRLAVRGVDLAKRAPQAAGAAEERTSKRRGHARGASPRGAAVRGHRQAVRRAVDEVICIAGADEDVVVFCTGAGLTTRTRRKLLI
jgi:hypothetical protein